MPLGGGIGALEAIWVAPGPVGVHVGSGPAAKEDDGHASSPAISGPSIRTSGQRR